MVTVHVSFGMNSALYWHGGCVHVLQRCHHPVVLHSALSLQGVCELGVANNALVAVDLQLVVDGGRPECADEVSQLAPGRHSGLGMHRLIGMTVFQPRHRHYGTEHQ